MSLHLERIEWMPSPPLVPDDGPIDFDHLRRMTLGDAGLEQEVLAMFVGPDGRPGRHARGLAGGCQRAGAHAEGLGAGDRRFCASPMPPPSWKRPSRRGFDPAAALADTEVTRLSRRAAAIEAILRRS